MDAFWTFARRMLRHRGLMALSITMAVISGAGLGAGLLGVVPVLRNILAPPGEAADLPVLAAQLNERVGGVIPAEWIALLPEGRFSAVFWVIMGLGVLTLIGAMANFLHSYYALTVVSRTVAGIRRDAFRRAVHLPLRTVVGSGTSDLISRIVNDSTTLAGGFNALLGRALAHVLKGLAAISAALVINWRLTCIALVVAPALGIVIRGVGRRIRRASRRALQAQAGLYHTAGEALGGLRVVKVHGSEAAEAGRFHRINQEVVKQELKVRTARAVASPLVETMAVFALGALCLIAAKAIIDRHLDATSFLVAMAALGVAGGSIKPLTGLLNDIQQSSAAAGRLNELLSLETEPGRGRRAARLPRHAISIDFENVWLTYPGAGSPALRGVSLRVPHGETLALVGPNGCGKTSLLSLVPRLFDPDEGRVLIDGHDVRDVSVRSLRRQIGVVTQETVLFRGTIRSNIAYGATGASEERIRESARRARAEEFILQRPGGYDEPIGEAGSGLSGGQRQRLAIARAILRNPAILILDEATSMIDAESEARIAEALTDFSRGRTCLVVAHRLSTVLRADRIAVMDQGQIVDVGTHRELLERCDVYRQIAETQLTPAGGRDGV